MIRFSYLVALTVALVLSGCVTRTDNINHARPVSSISELPLRKAGILVFREDEPYNNAAVNIYIDGSYLTSLQKHSYRYIDLCPGSHYWEAVFHNRDPAYYEKTRQENNFSLAANEVKYLKVSNSGYGRQAVQITPVSAQEAERVLPGLQLQNHTISRVVSGMNCQ